MSGRTIHGYFNLVRNLHKAKIDCFMSLSKGCSREERAEFISYDLCREIECTIDRFQQHPGEQNESIPEINKLIFTGEDYPVTPVDVLVIAGSPNCEYKVRRTLELGTGKSNLYIPNHRRAADLTDWLLYGSCDFIWINLQKTLRKSDIRF